MTDILEALDARDLDQAKMAVLQEIKRQFGMRAVFECETDAIIRAVFEATAAIAERDKLAGDNERLRANVETADGAFSLELRRHLETISRLLKAEEALRFYADPKNYSDCPADDGETVERAVPMTPGGLGDCDCGEIARAALQSAAPAAGEHEAFARSTDPKPEDWPS